MDEMIEISVREYKDLLEKEDKLARLEEAGVDNWSGYGDAMEGE